MSVPAENIKTAREFDAAGPADDDIQRHPYAAPDIVWHVPGQNPVAGRYHGVTDAFDAMPPMMAPLDEWRIDVTDVMSNDDLVVATVRLVARRGDIRVDTAGAHVFRFDANGAIAEAWGFVADQDQLDELFRAA